MLSGTAAASPGSVDFRPQLSCNTSKVQIVSAMIATTLRIAVLLVGCAAAGCAERGCAGRPCLGAGEPIARLAELALKLLNVRVSWEFGNIRLLPRLDARSSEEPALRAIGVSTGAATSRV